MAKPSKEERDAFLAQIKTDFDQRLAKIASDPKQWITFIDQVAVFGARYSLGNQLLLVMQAEQRGIEPRFFLPYGRKDASTGWLKHQRQVRRGEVAFKVWAPAKRRPTEEQAQQWEAAGRTVPREPSGRPAVQLVGFTLASTFELSQTDGEPFEPPTVQRIRQLCTSSAGLPQLLTGQDPTGAFDDLVKLIKDAGFSFDLVPPGSRYLRSANGVTVGSHVRAVLVRDDVDGAQRIKTTVHELAHIRCDHLTDTRDGQDLHRGRQETEAESVAYIVCKALGMDTAAYSDAYVMDWAAGDLDLVKQCAQTVLKVARQILDDLTPDDQAHVDEVVEPAEQSARLAAAGRDGQLR